MPAHINLPIIDALKGMIKDRSERAEIPSVTLGLSTELDTTYPSTVIFRTEAKIYFETRVKKALAWSEPERHIKDASRAITQRIYKPVIDRLYEIRNLAMQRGEDDTSESLSDLIKALEGRM